MFDPVTNTTAYAQVVLASNCPFNLLGRDLMVKLNISIVPDGRGRMKAKQNGQSHNVMVLDSDHSPHYSLTLDLPCNSPACTPEKLLEKAKQHVQSDSEFLSPPDLHVTLRYKRPPGPDPVYDKAIHKMGPQKLTITEIYHDERNTSFCIASL